MSASEKAAWLMAQAARAYGSQTLAAPGGAGRTGPAELGRDLARLIFGGGPGDPAMPALFSALIARPDSPEALTAVDTRIEEVPAQDAELAATVDGMLARFFTEQLQSGDGQALADAGSLLWWEEPQQARDAFERAIDLGNEHARIDLAQLHEAVMHDRPAALRLYQQAAASTDPDVVPALVAVIAAVPAYTCPFRVAWEGATQARIACVAVLVPASTGRPREGWGGQRRVITDTTPVRWLVT